MKCEIEFMPVGDGEKAGDAIIVRYGEPDNYRLMLIDGGFADTGEKIVNHLKYQFGPDVVRRPDGRRPENPRLPGQDPDQHE